MHCYISMNKYIHIHIFLILLYLTQGKCIFLNARSHDYGVPRSADGNKLVKDSDSTSNVNTALVEDAGVRAVGEVFVPKTFSISSQEPSCEQLRAMWIFSKRQSRAAEMTNEIPTYRDPFTYNVWEPIYSNSRLLGSIRMGARERARSPVFGRVLSREPIIPQRMSFEQRPRNLDGNQNGASQARLYGGEVRPSGIGAGAGAGTGTAGSSPRRSSKNRYVGVSTNLAANNVGGSHNSVAVHGSFQKLKELIWTERAKELTQQRRAEELAARAAVLKEIANGQNIQSSYKTPFNNPGDSLLMDENRSPDSSSNQYSNGDRISIANVQNFDASMKNVGHSNSGSRASTRRVGSAYRFLPTGQTRKESYFTGKVAAGRPKTYSRLRMLVTEINAGNSAESEHTSSIGIPRTYPVRQSHFRERNRSLFKQYLPNEYFRRNTRIMNSFQFGPQPELQKVGQNLNENYLSPLTTVEYYTRPGSNGLLYFNNNKLFDEIGLTQKSDEHDFNFDNNAY